MAIVPAIAASSATITTSAAPGARVTLTFDQHLRFDEDVGRVAAIMPEPGVGVRAARWLRLGTSYRMQYERNGNGDFELRHRFHLIARARVEPRRAVRVEYRLQLQEQVRPDANDTYRHSVRNRVAVEYRGLRPWRPGASIELHHDLDNGDTVHLDKVWLTVGVARDLGASEVELSYRAELPQFDPDAPTVHILGLGYHVDL